MTLQQLDEHVAAIVDRRGLEEDEDLLFSELEDDENLDGFRERRLQQLHDEYTRAKALRNQEHGCYTEIKDEKELMNITTISKRCIVHFFKSDFNRCQIMHNHLETLAPKHFDTRFLCINVDNAPFLVVKLKVQMLPCVLAFVEGISKDRLVGFEGIGHESDTFTTRELEQRLLPSGVLLRLTTVTTVNVQDFNQAEANRTNGRNIRDGKDNSSDSDWE